MKNSYIFCVLSIILWISNVTVVYGGQVDYNDCGSKANITELRLTGCTKQPCILYKGSTYDIEFDAISTSVSSKLPYKVQIETFVPITVLKGNACDVLSKGSCPVQSGMEFTYKNTIEVEKHYPSLHSKVKATVLDDMNNVLICVQLEVQIASKKASEHLQNVVKRLMKIRRLRKQSVMDTQDGLYYNYRL